MQIKMLSFGKELKILIKRQYWKIKVKKKRKQSLVLSMKYLSN
jgi:hypothetical protein